MGKVIPFALMVFCAVLFMPKPGGGAPDASSGITPSAESKAAARNRPIEKAQEQQPSAGNGFADVTLNRAADGHFYADAMVNGTAIHFLVDTGATTIALTREDAQRAGLQFSNDEFTASAQTANGPAALKPVTLNRVALGPLEANQVDAAIVDKGLNISLLGQNWLRQVGTVTIQGDRMVLR